ncbi:hypothetical protein LINGRAHAP2_LOCUS35980 [Linum grandiflorum]
MGRRPRKNQPPVQPSGEGSFLDELDGGGGESSWVVVKRQRVTILIPPPEDGGEAANAEAVEEDGDEIRTGIGSIDEQDEVGGVGELAPGLDVQIGNGSVDDQDEIAAAVLVPGSDVDVDVDTNEVNPVSTIQREPGLDDVIEETNASVRIDRGNAPKTLAALAPSSDVEIDTNETIQMQPCLDVGMEEPNVDRRRVPLETPGGVSNGSKIIKRRPRMLPGLRSLLDGRLLLDQTLRATLIERKLEKAGGLSNWLGSIGLGQFEAIFHSGEYELVNLTMNKLKDMGVDAVGPRRKLMHAIDCICQPYCFGSK